ncbi:MAG: RseA family anti-sigma factor [Sterolibacterium sp.]|nr:RseA family anti-sigma factor [Sterolibacterium sp.]
MKTELSTLLDDELEAYRHQSLLTALRNDTELRATMANYLLIGDALRGIPDLTTNLTASVMARLDKEPTLLAPPARRSAGLLRDMAALAASLTGVAVVAWLALSPPASPTLVPPVAQAKKPDVIATSERMQEYLMAHQAYAPSSRIQGGASYIRTISASR